MSATRILLLCSLLLTAGCTGGYRSGPVIPQDTFADIYLDLLVAAGREHDSASSPVLSPADSVLKRRGTTTDEYRRSLELYNRDPESWRAFFAVVIRKGMERESKAAEDQRTDSRDQH
jgi:hypothetical protein